MSDGALEQKTIYLIGLSPEDEGLVRDDFHAYPFPDWRLAILPMGTPPPVDVLAGQAILVIGVDRGPAAGSTETMWMLRLFACGCPWVALAYRTDRVSRARCELAGAVAYLSWPFGPPTLRELIWRHAVPLATSDTPPPSLTCHRMARCLTVIRADVLLKFSSPDGRTGYLATRGGKPISAQILNGSGGDEGLQELLAWGAGRVSGHSLPADQRVDLFDSPQSWVDALGVSPRTPEPAGGREVCDRLVSELPTLTTCAVVDLDSGQVVARPSGTSDQSVVDDSCVSAVAELLRPVVHNPDGGWSEEVFVRSPEELWAAVWLRRGSFALVMSADGMVPLNLVQSLFADATSEFGQGAGLLVEEVRVAG